MYGNSYNHGHKHPNLFYKNQNVLNPQLPPKQYNPPSIYPRPPKYSQPTSIRIPNATKGSSSKIIFGSHNGKNLWPFNLRSIQIWGVVSPSLSHQHLEFKLNLKMKVIKFCASKFYFTFGTVSLVRMNKILYILHSFQTLKFCLYWSNMLGESILLSIGRSIKHWNWIPQVS